MNAGTGTDANDANDAGNPAKPTIAKKTNRLVPRAPPSSRTRGRPIDRPRAGTTDERMHTMMMMMML